MFNQDIMKTFLEFDRAQWSALRKNVPLKLTEQDLKPLLGINEELSLDEVKIIYLPLTRLINYYIEADIRRHFALNHFLDYEHQQMPFIIGITGSVAVGKSTLARILQRLLSQWPHSRKVELITTDSFLYPLEVLTEKNLLEKKGFPASYDLKQLMEFLFKLKSGQRNIKTPIYSHLIYDIIPNKFNFVDQPEILILEGLNILQPNKDMDKQQLFVSDFVDFSIYVDADETLLLKWYIDRFLRLRSSAFADPDSYFHSYANTSENEAISLANKVWQDINGKNLHENILPTRERADLILEKGDDHTIKKINLRK